MGANDPRGGAIFDPRGMVGRIYKQDHYILLHTKYERSWPCGFREDYFCFSQCKSMGANDPVAGPFLTPKEDHYTLLHTKYESFGPSGFGDLSMFFP